MSLFDDFSEDELDDIDDGLNDDAAPPLDEFTHPRSMDFSVGHEDNEQALLKLFETGRMPQALVFCGPSGIGKATTAYRFARFLLAQDSANGQDSLFGEPPAKAQDIHIGQGHAVFKRVASGGHPDLLVVERDYDESKNRYKDIVSVESVRRVAPFLRMTASEGGWRVVIIDDADTMNRSAQNALLKILEEPPQKVLLILIAHRSGALIPTIHSRTQFMNFKPLTADALLKALQRQYPSLTVDQADFLSSFAQGSLGRALASLEEDVFDVFQSVTDMFIAWPHWQWLDIYALSDELAPSQQKFEMFHKLMLWIMNALALQKARGCSEAYDMGAQKAFAAFFAHSSLEDLLKICENLEAHFNKVNFANLDKKQAVSGAFSLITE